MNYNFAMYLKESYCRNPIFRFVFHFLTCWFVAVTVTLCYPGNVMCVEPPTVEVRQRSWGVRGIIRLTQIKTVRKKGLKETKVFTK